MDVLQIVSRKASGETFSGQSKESLLTVGDFTVFVSKLGIVLNGMPILTSPIKCTRLSETRVFFCKRPRASGKSELIKANNKKSKWTSRYCAFYFFCYGSVNFLMRPIKNVNEISPIICFCCKI